MVITDYYRLALDAEGATLDAIGERFNVYRYVGMITREADVVFRTRVIDAIVQARMAEARAGE